MDNSQYYNTGAINFIRILFRFSLAFIVLVVVLLFVLKVEDTVKVRSGVVFSESPQNKLVAPAEVKVVGIKCREGQQVKKGDTLFILENTKTKTDFNIANLDRESLEEKVALIRQLKGNAIEKRSAIQAAMSIQSDIYFTERSKITKELESLEAKMDLSKRQRKIQDEKYRTDSLLYGKGAISQVELREQKNRSLDARKSENEVQSSYQQRLFDLKNLSNKYEQQRNESEQSMIELSNQITNYEREILDLQTQSKNQEYNLEYFSEELGKLVVLAPIDGTISNLFNVKQSQSIIPKGELLGILAPKGESYYAKITLAEKDLNAVKVGQKVSLQMDAYNYYKFGAVEGRITYVSPSEVNQTFSCLVEFEDYNPEIKLKAGYTMKGKVVVEELPLRTFIVKKILKKFDPEEAPEDPYTQVKPESKSTK